jgi:5-methylcytosine-specific restriction enzyme subunit McrC
MSSLTLREYQVEPAVPLTVNQRDALARLVPTLAIRPTAGSADRYDLKPSSVVGSIHLDDLDIVILPKVPFDRLLFILSYSLGRVRGIAASTDLEQADDLVEAIVAAFVHQVGRAIARGVQQDYRTVDESALTLRGRLRIGDQIRRRFGPYPPAEITYDDYTVDTDMNRILRAATERLLRMRLRSHRSRMSLRAIQARMDGVSLVPFDPRRIPRIRFTRLNERYRGAIGLATLILRSSSFDIGHGDAPASSFLVDMNAAFEDFVVEALRDALRSTPGVLVQGARGHPLHLDAEKRIKLEPDLSFWVDGECRWLGDVKYKRVKSLEYPNADLYQVTSYAVASGLSNATLIYAKSEGDAGTHHIVNVNKTIHADGLDLAAPPKEILAQIDRLADAIRVQAAGRSPVAA